MKRIAYIVLWIIVAICSLPIVGAVWAAWFANRHGCSLNEAGSHPCIVNGTDWGQTLAGVFVSGWFAIVTIPIGLAALAIIIVMFIVGRIRKRRAGKSDMPRI